MATPLRQRIGGWVDSDPVQRFVLTIIVVNAITLGLETSPWVMSSYGTALHWLDTAALVIFVVEIGLKLVAHGWRFFADPWNLFDFLVVAIALVPGAGPFAVLRSLRVLRVLRLVNRMPQLRFIVEAILKALPGIAAIAGLMCIIFYVSAVMATTLFGPAFPDWFGSLGASLYTLFQIMTLESWSMGIVRPVMEAYPWAWLFFVLFIVLSAFTMLNLFVAVIVDTMSNLHDEKRAAQLQASALPGPTTQDQLAELRREIAELSDLIRTQGDHPR
ncbi:MAG: ion transporter [Propionibacteriaceae bacterium]|nr:ion transporter [Propionibacteriaceae bacterium]